MSKRSPEEFWREHVHVSECIQPAAHSGEGVATTVLHLSQDMVFVAGTTPRLTSLCVLMDYEILLMETLVVVCFSEAAFRPQPKI